MLLLFVGWPSAGKGIQPPRAVAPNFICPIGVYALVGHKGSLALSRSAGKVQCLVSRKGVLWCCAILFIVLSFCGRMLCLAQERVSLQDRFLSEAPKKWTEYRARTARFQGSIIHTQTDMLKVKQVVRHVKYELKQKLDSAWLLLDQRLDPKEQIGIVEVVNPRYAFKLRRASPAAPWAVVHVDLDLADGITGLYHPRDAVDYGAGRGLYFFSGRYCLPSLIQDPRFTLKNVSLTAGKDTDCVKVEFDVTQEEPGRDVIRSGWIALDPAQYWIVRAYELQAKFFNGTGVITGSYEYDRGESNTPLLRLHVRRQKGTFNTGEALDHEYRYECQFVERDVPESEFTLSAFGIPEPPGMTQPTRWYLWAGVAAFVCLGLAVLLRRMRRSS